MIDVLLPMGLLLLTLLVALAVTTVQELWRTRIELVRLRNAVLALQPNESAERENLSSYRYALVWRADLNKLKALANRGERKCR